MNNVSKMEDRHYGVDVQFLPGVHIETAVKEAIAESDRRGGLKLVTFDFNGVKMRVTGCSRPEKAVEYFMDEINNQAEQYRNSPEGKAQQEEHNRKVAEAGKKFDELGKIDISKLSRSGLLDYLCSVETYSIVPYPDKSFCDWLYDTLEVLGYKENENTDDKFNKEDKDNVYHYLIGQCMSCLSRGLPPHPMLHNFIKEYKEKFNA